MFFISSYSAVFSEILFVFIPFVYALRYSRFWPTVSAALHLAVFWATKRSYPVRRGITVTHVKQQWVPEKAASAMATDSYVQEKQLEPDLYDSTLNNTCINGDLMPRMSFVEKVAVN